MANYPSVTNLANSYYGLVVHYWHVTPHPCASSSCLYSTLIVQSLRWVSLLPTQHRFSGGVLLWLMTFGVDAGVSMSIVLEVHKMEQF